MDILSAVAFFKDLLLHYFKIKSDRQKKLEELLILLRRYKGEIEGFVNYLDKNLNQVKLPGDINDYHRSMHRKMESITYWRFVGGHEIKSKLSDFLLGYENLRRLAQPRAHFLEEANDKISIANRICGDLLDKIIH